MRHSQSLESFDLSNIPDDDKAECVSLTLWIPVEVKEKYDQIQKLSRRKFGKFLKQILIKNVENVKIDD